MGIKEHSMENYNDTVQNLINNNKVMVFSKSYCPFATGTKQLLQDKGVAFQTCELDVEANGAQLHDALKEISKQRTVPNVYINGKHMGGNDDMHTKLANGKLKQALDEAGVAHTI